MVTIIKDNEKLLVPVSSFREHYKRNGWKIASTPKVEDVPEVASDNTAIPEDEGNMVNNEEEEMTQNDTEITKPLGEMTIEELMEYAENNGINIEGLETKKEIRKAIKNAIG